MTNNKQAAAALIIGLFALALAGCGAAAGKTTPPAVQSVPAASPEETATVAAFNALVAKKDVRAAELLAAVDAGIGKVTRNEASAMIVAAEAAQKRDLKRLEELLSRDGLQRKIDNLYRAGLDPDKAGDTGDAELRDALLAVRDGGYRVDTAEGMYYPVIDYGRYRKYRGAVTDDLAAYIDLMAVESDRAPAKDAALVIGWDEVVRRALAQEGYLKAYEDSPRSTDVKHLYARYLTFVFYGANNTPLFSYDSQTMNPAARTAYAEAAKGDSRLASSLRGYLDILAKNGYRLDGGAEEYRKLAVRDLQE
jgi:hypothetical protein